MKKIVIIGDSLALPRPWDGLVFEDTYPFLLSQTGERRTVINISRRANTSTYQATEIALLDSVDSFKPDIAVLHLGIVDCAPRLFSRFQQRVLERIPMSVSKKIIRFFSLRRTWFTRHFPKVYVRPNEFKKSIGRILERIRQHHCSMIVIGICTAPESLSKRSIGINANIRKYNQMLKESAKLFGACFVDVSGVLNPQEDLLSDGIHLNQRGSRKLFELLENIIGSDEL